jgi:hypothetical protein
VERLPQPITLDQFELGVTLGTGSFGRVRFVVHKVRTLVFCCVLLPLALTCEVSPPFQQPTRGIWALKMLKKAEVVRLQQVFTVFSAVFVVECGCAYPFYCRGSV